MWAKVQLGSGIGNMGRWGRWTRGMVIDLVLGSLAQTGQGGQEETAAKAEEDISSSSLKINYEVQKEYHGEKFHSALFLMKALEFLEHHISGRKVFDKMYISRRDTILNKAPKSTVITLLDVVSIWGRSFIRARKGLIKPGVEAMAEGDERKFTTPLHPVGFAKVEDEVRGPVSTIDRDCRVDADTFTGWEHTWEQKEDEEGKKGRRKRKRGGSTGTILPLTEVVDQLVHDQVSLNHTMGYYEPRRSPSVVDNLALGIRNIAVEDDALLSQQGPYAAFLLPEYGQYYPGTPTDPFMYSPSLVTPSAVPASPSAWVKLWYYEVATISTPVYQHSASVCSTCRVWYPFCDSNGPSEEV
ncbi:hypothetical protein F5888DRAFT_1638504 [Russula emetica]|nr:hypothetical protein F5888DRAFT_1638504 [Russula emetica]